MVNGLEGKRAVVSGGTRGIGAAIVEQLLHEGVRVVTAARTQPGQLPEGVGFVRADLSTADGVEALAKYAHQRLGVVDIVVSNAGGQTVRAGGALELTDADYRNDLDSNLMSAVRLDRAFVPDMAARGAGAVVHIGSVAARIARPQTLAYSVAKAALTTYSKGLAAEVGPRGVRVNVVHPGIIRTDRFNRRVAQAAQDGDKDENSVIAAMVRQTGVPLNRVGSAAELAAVVIFLVSPAASYMSGAQIMVDGGAMPTV